MSPPEWPPLSRRARCRTHLSALRHRALLVLALMAAGLALAAVLILALMAQ